MRIFHCAILITLSLLLILAAPAWAQTGAAESGASDLPAAASELLSANPENQETAPAAPPSQTMTNDQIFPLPESPAPRFGVDLLWAGGMFILVLTLLFITLKALGRFSLKGRGRANIFNLRGTLPLDNRKYLAAVEVEGRMLIVGVTPERITAVTHWTVDSDADEGFAFQFKNDTELPHITDPLAGGAK